MILIGVLLIGTFTVLLFVQSILEKKRFKIVIFKFFSTKSLSPMHPLRYEIAAKALSRKEDGKPLFSLSALAEQYGCSNSTVSRYRDKYAETDKIEDERKENHGEEKLSEKEQRVLLRIFQKEPSTSLRSATEKLANNHDIVISPSTARSYLKGFGLRSYMKAIKHTLNAIVKKKRYQFALKYKHKTLEW